jgi:phospholipase C
MSRIRRYALATLASVMALTVFTTASYAQTASPAANNPINHIVVIYLENHSFDELYGEFPGANGLANAKNAAPQVDKDGNVYKTLPQPRDTTLATPGADSRFPGDLPNASFPIEQYVPIQQKTGDLVHRYYQEQYQIDGGKMDKFVAWSDSAGLSMGYYHTAELPMYKYAQQFTLADNFFHAAFGGSYLNHIYMICACVPKWTDAPADRIAKLDSTGMVVTDGVVTPDGYAVNTTYSSIAPHPKTVDAAHLMPPFTETTIGDRLDEQKINWAWYSGGWNNAVAGTPDSLFQFHHQPFSYFKNYGLGTDAGKQHLKDITDFNAALKDGSLPAVSFVKPLGDYNEHPGYTDTMRGDTATANMVSDIMASPVWKDTAIIITYDENGGQWDHVAPPTVDKWGPGSRVPAIIISPYAKKGFIDHTQMDTTSILAFIEARYGLQPLGTRDAKVANMMDAFDFTQKP